MLFMEVGIFDFYLQHRSDSQGIFVNCANTAKGGFLLMPSTDHQQPLLSVQPAVTIKPVGNVFPVVYSLCAISLFLLYIFRFRYPSDFILWILFGLLSFPVSLLLHSIGHLLMGKLFGGKFLALNCGCIRIAAKTDRLRFEPRRSTDGRGCCYMHFSSALSPVRRLLFHGGGALINFLSAALCYLVSYFPLSPPGNCYAPPSHWFLSSTV